MAKYLDEDGLLYYNTLKDQQIALKAPLASPALTGTPTAPTASNSTNNTQIATTAFVKNVLPTVNDGTLTITQGTSTLGTFTANQSTNTTIALPANATVNDATITIKKNGTTVGDFTLNQASNEDINISVPVAGTITSGSTGYATGGDVYDAINSITGISFEVVQTLPASGSTGVIYLVPNSGSGTNTYDEYIWLADASRFEKIGTTDVDLSGYVPTSRTINGHALTSNISLTASDVSALPSSTTYVSSVNGSSGAVTGIQTTGNLVTSISGSSTDAQYPSAKLLYDQLALKQGTMTAITNAEIDAIVAGE